ncbi:MAG: DUF1292 domain-containing protein [Bacilli bacterium]|nr:DUF1292 domain-containing protein [Bacilli bacterium]
MGNKVTITNPKGQKVSADLITIFRSNENNQDYAVYTFNQKDQNNNIKDYVSRVRVENGEYYFDTITDNNECEMVKGIISEMVEGGI